jgi:hypothetical protein
MVNPSAQFSLILRVELERRPGTLGRLTSATGSHGGLNVGLGRAAEIRR